VLLNHGEIMGVLPGVKGMGVHWGLSLKKSVAWRFR